jgi:hypothetical protein
LANKEITVQKAFDMVIAHCNPIFDDGYFGLVYDLFFGGGHINKKTNFIGGCGDKRRTKHERIFSLLYPNFKQQVAFGTGKGGYEIYGAKRYIVDFYDESKKIAYEIDGRNHSRHITKIVDTLKSHCLYHVHGIMTYHFTNKQVEEMLMERIKKIEAAGRLHEFVGGDRQDKSA